MRLTLTQLLLSGLLMSTVFAREGKSQELLSYKITINKKQETVKLIFSEIEKSLDVKFLYSSNLLNPNQKVSLSKNETLGSILTKILTPLDLEYEVADRQIIIKPILVPLGQKRRDDLGSSRPSLDSLIKGVVVDEKGEALPGVNVLIKGTQRGTVTDVKGNFSIDVSASARALIFSYVGYLPQEIAITNSTSLKISLKADQKSLEEVVVIGYGTQRKVDVTGSVASISSAAIMERPSPNALGALQGLVPGLNITSNSGRPGDMRVNIRGFNSINASNNPLFVVDGVIGVDYSTINPNDIETIDVLKDASSTAIYGARGSGGVIIITTKRGKDGKTAVNLNISGGYNVLPREIPLLNSTQYQTMEKAAYAFVPGRAYPDFAKLEPLLYNADGTPKYNTNWQREVYKPSFSQNYNLSIAGGSPNVKYSMNYGYQDDHALMLFTYLKKYSARINVDAKVNSWLTTGLNLSAIGAKERIQDDGVGGFNGPRNTMEQLPMIPVKMPDGSWGGNFMHLNSEGSDNPVNWLTNYYNINNKVNVLGNSYLNFRLADNLEFKTSLSLESFTNKNDISASGSAVQRGLYQRIRAGINTERSLYWQSSSYFTYKKQLNEANNLNIILGTEWAKKHNETFGASSANFDSDFYLANNLGAGIVPNPPTSNVYDWQIHSYFSRITYSLLDKYLFTATGRYDGSSKFGANHKYAFFPSAAVAWRVSEEDFLKNFKTVSDLKIRLSYGSTGNSEIGQYQSIGALASNTAIFGGARAGGQVQGRIPNPNLQWEKTNQLNIGVDLGLFNNRINAVADFYNKITTGLLLNAPVPFSSGFDNVLSNIGSVRNRGFELGLTTRNLIGAFKWNTTLNFSANKTKILALGLNNEDIFPGPGFLDQTNILRVGESVGTFYGLTRLGTWGDNESAEAAKAGAKPGDIKESTTKSVLGHAYPKYVAEIINKFSYKNFELVVDIQVSQGNSVLNLGYATSEDRQTLANSYTTVLNAWTPTNQNTSIAKVRLNGDGPSLRQDSHYVQDGSFVRGKNISLSYTVPKSITDKLHLSGLRMFAGVQNAFLITKYKTGYDPEVSTYPQAFAYGIEFYAQPKARTFNLGANISL
ncbi:TonB-dependent receptor [Dyadobacter sp. LHD-138]|uniref:TonB-dependent receptor n=1 Tax=Dyadobacter sp. LHD-138 TaxID=3071413 RepID=UPI0027E1F360|nr:TonB-dependent receptor [Dyadobacter sp. LHD-138]MDQ6481777.1 TonB-dependent receptor [Dyadobacter sp. LHD-138]